MRVNLAAQLFVICLSVQEYESYTLVSAESALSL